MFAKTNRAELQSFARTGSQPGDHSVHYAPRWKREDVLVRAPAKIRAAYLVAYVVVVAVGFSLDGVAVWLRAERTRATDSA